jgi:hypothetical protein
MNYADKKTEIYIFSNQFLLRFMNELYFDIMKIWMKFFFHGITIKTYIDLKLWHGF